MILLSEFNMYSYIRFDDEIYTILFNYTPVLIVFSRSTAETIVNILNSDFKLALFSDFDTLRS